MQSSYDHLTIILRLSYDHLTIRLWSSYNHLTIILQSSYDHLTIISQSLFPWLILCVLWFTHKTQKLTLESPCISSDKANNFRKMFVRRFVNNSPGLTVQLSNWFGWNKFNKLYFRRNLLFEYKGNCKYCTKIYFYNCKIRQINEIIPLPSALAYWFTSRKDL